MKILIVGGTFSTDKNIDGTYGKPSGLINKLSNVIRVYDEMNSNFETIVTYNGGSYEELNKILEKTPDYNIVFWFANVSNDLPKIRDVKKVAPMSLLITSKRNDNNKYSFQELVQRALASKSNLMFEFSKIEENLFNISVIDPLGCQWYNGTNLIDAVNATINRLLYLASITRQGTIRNKEDRTEILNQVFSNDNKTIVAETNQFVNIVHKYAECFHDLVNPASDVKRFLGNCSMKPIKEFRCLKGMPSFKYGDYIFVSQRNVDKEFLDINHFVPTKLENDKIYYCGSDKPSVDTPIQLRLYEALPNIKYMIHSHCYIENAEFTTKSIPCGAIEEVDEVLAFIDKYYKSRELNQYKINLIGHGSIIMGNAIDDINNVTYIKRPMPEKVN